MPSVVRKAMPAVLSRAAYQFAQRKKPGKKYGLGRYISELLVAEEARELARDELARQRPATRHEGDSSGCQVEP